MNGLGATAWLAGLMYAKGLGGRADLFAADDHHLAIGAAKDRELLQIAVFAHRADQCLEAR